MKSEPQVKHRMTKQKRIILEVLKNTKSHPTADWVYEKVKKKIPNVSLGTVYRNLNILKNQGEITELCYGKGFSRFDGNPSNHYHFTCEKCGKIMDVEIGIFTEVDKAVAKHMSAKIDHHRLEFYGACQDCVS